MIRNALFIFILLASFSYAKSDKLDKIISLQKSLAKDFIIYQYLQKPSTTSEEATLLLNYVYKLNPKLKKAFYEKIDDAAFKYMYECEHLREKELLNVDKTCQFIALTPIKVEKLSHEEKSELYKNLKDKYETRLTWLKNMLQEDVFNSLLKDPKEFLKLFLQTSKDYNHINFDKPLPEKFLSKLANTKGFEAFVMRVVMDRDFQNLSNSLLLVNPKRKMLSFQSSFYLGILALMRDKNSLALKYFKRSESDAKKPDLKARALFWQYQTKLSDKSLEKLSKSENLNFYSLYARELLHKKDFYIYSPKPFKEELKNYSITDPFTWKFTKKHIKKMSNKRLDAFSKRFFTKATLPYYIYMQQRVHGYKRNYFITPYEQYINNLDEKRKTLIYAIARQESRCIPCDISTSYALGMMQFMPFLAKATAKDMDFKGFNYQDMFKPDIALNFANYHLEYLETNLKKPLFIAYGYNGGIGFTKRLFTQKHLFKKGKYEPFLSMELIDYAESREYGKKVLANYAVYGKMFGLNITLEDLLQNLTSPFEQTSQSQE